jgi:hypothetical protein
MEENSVFEWGGAGEMSDLERVENEYRTLQTEVIYSSLAGDLDPSKRQRLELLADELMRLTDPDFSDCGIQPEHSVA